VTVKRAMTPDEWHRVKTILEGVLDQPAEARESYIASACAGDATLRARVTALAEAAAGDGGMLDASNAVEAGAEVPDAPSREGERVGAYELLAEIGQGGMGTVHLARRADDEFEKRVAIKLMRPGFATAARSSSIAASGSSLSGTASSSSGRSAPPSSTPTSTWWCTAT
jgi:hypothetical protein